jgi:ABC-type transport system involved in multi-copper enzyme maturation permease subunit
MNPSHVGLVVGQEFRIRLRTGRWRWLLGAWLVLLAVFTLLLDAGLNTGFSYVPDDTLRGVPLFGFLMFFVLGSMLVISPALTAQTINGDRERGTLATLQVTRLRPAEIAIGKLLASWSVGLVALALSIPFAGYAMSQGGITIGRVAAVYGVVALLIGTVCAVSQALSALLARSITSALLSYVVTAVLAVGTLVAFALGLALSEERVVVTNRDGYTYTNYESHPERVWWLLAPNPFVILADSAPRVPPHVVRSGDVIYIENYDPLSEISNAVRRIRSPQAIYLMASTDPDVTSPSAEEQPVWPYGLAFSILLGAGSLVLTTVRLRTPSNRLPRGVRVA